MIANFNQLASTSLRKQALLISEAGISALAIEPYMKQVGYDGRRDVLLANGEKFSLAPFQHVILVGLGTGSFSAANRLAESLGQRLTAGLIIDEQEGQIPRVLSRRATSNPSIANHSITKELIALARDCAEDDVIITVQTGGRDLLAAPAGMLLDDKRSIINSLINAGASPFEVETVKKHLSLVKGGNLAKLSYPASMINLIFDNRPESWGGLTMRDESTIHDAQGILRRYNALERSGLASVQLLETPKEQSYFERVKNLTVPIGYMALQAMVNKARDLGYRISKDNDMKKVNSGEAWIGQGSLPGVAVHKLPQQGILLNFDGQQGMLLDNANLAGARKSGLADLSVDNWVENMDIPSDRGRFALSTKPLAVYLRA